MNALLQTHPLMTPAEVAERLLFHVSTIYDMVEAGEMEALRRDTGKSHMRITRRSLDAWLARGLSDSAERLEVLVTLAATLTTVQRGKLIANLQGGSLR